MRINTKLAFFFGILLFIGTCASPETKEVVAKWSNETHSYYNDETDNPTAREQAQRQQQAEREQAQRRQQKTGTWDAKPKELERKEKAKVKKEREDAEVQSALQNFSNSMKDQEEQRQRKLKAERERLNNQMNRQHINDETAGRYQDEWHRRLDAKKAAEWERQREEGMESFRQTEREDEQEAPIPQSQPKQQTPESAYEAPPEPEQAAQESAGSFKEVVVGREYATGPGQSSESLMDQTTSNDFEEIVEGRVYGAGSDQSSASLMDQIASNSPEQKQPPVSEEQSSAKTDYSEQQAAQESPGSGQSSASLIDQIASNSPEQKQPPVSEEQSSAQTDYSDQQAAQESYRPGQSSESLMEQITSGASVTRETLGSYAHDVAVETGRSLGNETVRSMVSGDDYPNPETIAKDAASVELAKHAEDEIVRHVSKDLPPDERHDAEERALGFALIRDGSTGNLYQRITNSWNAGLDTLGKRVDEMLTNPDGTQDKEGKSSDLKEKRRVVDVEEKYYDYGPRENPSIRERLSDILIKKPFDDIFKGFNEITINKDGSK